MKDKNKYGFGTRAVHAGSSPDPSTGARNVPIYQTSSYVFNDTNHAASLFNLQDFGYLYSRLNNPTVSALEERIASLENGRGAVACSSGHAAQHMAFTALLQSGDHFIASQNLYGGSLNQFTKTFSNFGWKCSIVNPKNTQNFVKAIRKETKFIFLETLANPGGVIVDIDKVATVAKDADILLIVDNTMATPYLHRPFEWGADIVTHSLTKFISGHGTSMGGVVVESGKIEWDRYNKFSYMTDPSSSYHGLKFTETFGDFAYTMKLRAEVLRDLGYSLSPTNAFNILTGAETLHLRMNQHISNALLVAEYLSHHPKVHHVSYAGLKSNPYYELAKKYMPKGPGSVFTISLKGGYDACVSLVENVELLSHVANLGDTRSLIIHPASTTHNQLSNEEKILAGAGPDIIRLSIGIETVNDIINDLDQALNI